MTPTPEEICKELARVLKTALDQTGCDGDLCGYRWHEDARKVLEEFAEMPARLSPPSPEAAGNPNVPAGPAVAEGVKGETRRVWESPQLGLLYVWDGRFIWAHLKDRQWATVNKRIDDMPDKWELTGPDAAKVLADFDMREVSRG